MNIILCIPGNNFSREFVLGLIGFISEANRYNIQIRLSMHYSAVVHFARAKCLGADVLLGENQTPFHNATDYDYVLWIDSDIMFGTQSVLQLLRHFQDNNQLEVVSGWYSMSDAQNTTMMRKWDDDYFLKNGSYQFTSIQEMEGFKESLVECEYVGMGFMMIKRQAFQKLKYPWFYEPLQEIGDTIRDMCSEDVAFCKKLVRAGVKIWVDPKCRVGHQKMVVL